MKWNVNPVALISQTTELELQTPFIAILLTLNGCNGIQTYNHLVRKRTLWPWLNGWVFVYKLFVGLSHWYSDNYRVWIHSETRTWHDKNIQSY